MADPATFAEQAAQYRQPLHRAALRRTRNHHDAEDLVQETYLRAYRGFGGFEQGTNISAWLHRILANAFNSCYRARQRRPDETSSDAIEQLAGHSLLRSYEAAFTGRSGEDEFLDATLDGALIGAIAGLPPQFRSAVLLAD